jgi:spermidine synthase
LTKHKAVARRLFFFSLPLVIPPSLPPLSVMIRNNANKNSSGSIIPSDDNNNNDIGARRMAAAPRTTGWGALAVVHGTILLPSLGAIALVLIIAAVATTTSATSAAAPTSLMLQLDKVPAATSEFIEETGFYQSLRLKNEQPLFHKQSKYQTIEVHESDYYGKILILDRVLQLTERDANAYNEMLAHIPMFQHMAPRRVLVIGGGDGYVLSEVLKHDSVIHVDHVDLDEDVVNICREHFAWGQAWQDPRVRLHIADGAAFVRDAADGYYDVVVQDSSDPWTWADDGAKIVLPSSVLYSEQHFANIYRILGPNGVLAIQAESLAIPSDVHGIREWRELALQTGFETSRYSSITISSYPTGQIGLLCVRTNIHLYDV